MRKYGSILVLCLVVFSCNKETKYSNIPKISFLDLSRSIVKAGSDSIINVRFKFEDGDGNIGFNTPKLIFIDSRSGDTTPFTIPVIPTEQSPENGISGVIVIDYNAGFLLLRPDTAHLKRDTLHWNIFMKDEAKNESNLIRTSDLILVDSL
jgi:hypothetical protein